MNKEFNLLKQILTHPAAYNVGIGGMLEIRSLTGGRFAVWADNSEEHMFENIDDAVRCFLALREAYHIGLDHELKDIESGIMTAREKYELRKYGRNK